MNKSINTALLLGALICAPAYAAPDTPKPKTVKAKLTHIVTLQVTGMA